MYISIDLGGTNTRVASSSDLKTINKIEKFETQKTLDAQRNLITSAALNVAEGEPIRHVCLGVPGLVDKKHNKLGNIVNFPIISGLEFDALFGEELRYSTFIGENDADLAGLGEAVFGTGANHDVVAYITLSTGVGGVRIQEKKLNRKQEHSEPGHQIIIENGTKDTKVEMYGTWDAYVSGIAFEKNYGVSAQECHDQDVWNDYAEKLAAGMVNVIAFWAPEIIVIGGGISNKFDEYIKRPLLKNLEKQDTFLVPAIEKAKLGDSSGIYGGFALIEQLNL